MGVADGGAVLQDVTDRAGDAVLVEVAEIATDGYSIFSTVLLQLAYGMQPVAGLVDVLQETRW